MLARVYRPVGFDDMIGQDATVRVLRRAFATGRVAHAFMLTGVRGVGKTTTARIIARALACIGPDGSGGPTADPCGVCANCVAILADRHPDVLEMDAASRTGVEDVREIIEATRFRPMQARAKVFIIDEVHMLSRNAFNALLKTLEEPPDHVTFVFATTELRKVPVTVLSRCQRFDLRRVKQDVLAAHFAGIAARERVDAAPDAIRMIARAADGSVRDGLSLLDQAIATAPRAENGGLATIEADAVASMLGLADRTRVFDLLDAVLAGDAAASLAVADELATRGADPGEVLGDLLDAVHAASRLKSIPSLATDQSLPELERERGGALASRVGAAVLGRAWQMLLKGVGEVETAPDRQAAAAMVLIRLCHVANGPTPGELVRRLTDGPASAPRTGPPPRPPADTAPQPHPPMPAEPAAPRPPPAPSGNAAPTAPRASAAGAPPATAPSGGTGSGTASGAGSGAIAAGAVARALAVDHASHAPPRPSPATWRDAVALIADTGRDPILLAHLRQNVRPVRVLPGIVEIRQLAGAPRDLASRLGRALADATGERWTVALSTEPGDPTLAERGVARLQSEHEAALRDPLIAEMLRVFPGAEVAILRDDPYDETQDAAQAGEGLSLLGGDADGDPALEPEGGDDMEEDSDA